MCRRFLWAVGVSSVTGDGVKEFFDAVEASREEYERYVSAQLNCQVTVSA